MNKAKNVYYLLILLLGIISCNGQENKRNTKINNSKNVSANKEIPALFDKEYFHGYQLSADSDFPLYTHTDKNFGDLTVNFINRDLENQKQWENYDAKNNLFPGDNPNDKYFNQLNKVIKKKLEPNLNDYKIVAEYVPAKYMGQSLDYIYPYTKEYYLYNKDKKSWDFLKEKRIADGANEKNITKLSEFNSMLNIFENDRKKNITKGNNSPAIGLNKIDGVWKKKCNAENSILISSAINSIQLTCLSRFSMNAELKEISVNKYEIYFTDFPTIIPLQKEMQNWENLDHKKSVGILEIKSESEIILNWTGFFYKKTEKYIQTDNPFNENTAILIKCSE